MADERMLDALARQVLALIEQCKALMNTIEAMREHPTFAGNDADPTTKVKTFGKVTQAP